MLSGQGELFSFRQKENFFVGLIRLAGKEFGCLPNLVDGKAGIGLKHQNIGRVN